MKIIREETNECLTIDLDKNDVEIFDNDNTTKLNLVNDDVINMSVENDDTWYAVKQIINL